MNASGEQARSTIVDAEEFRGVIGRFVTGVTVVTCDRDGRHFGTTASAVASVSLSPPTVLVCMDRGSETREAVLAAGRFALNILHEGQREIALRFARKGDAKFDGVEVVTGASGAPLLPGALGLLECEVTEAVEAATHTVLLAQVLEIGGTPGLPLAHFGGQFAWLDSADRG